MEGDYHTRRLLMVDIDADTVMNDDGMIAVVVDMVNAVMDLLLFYHHRFLLYVLLNYR